MTGAGVVFSVIFLVTSTRVVNQYVIPPQQFYNNNNCAPSLESSSAQAAERTAATEDHSWFVDVKSRGLNPLWNGDDGQLCRDGNWNHVCACMIVLERKRVSFCSAAKVASTAIRDYFLHVAEGDVKVDETMQYPIHQAPWPYLHMIRPELRKRLVSSLQDEWTSVFFMKHVIDRFVSGYLDKVVHDCKTPDREGLAIHYYDQYGFSCNNHTHFESFVGFMETVPHMETHFGPQTTFCEFGRYPYTHLIFADEGLTGKLRNLSFAIGANFTPPSKKTANHKTGSKMKAVELFRGRKDLLRRVLDMFEVDCRAVPNACDVSELLRQI
ncbi:MAG: hypothetical protein SGILL_008405 [Bacillariaceae sp.]